MTWVLITNTNDCRIYKFERKPVTLSLIQEIQHPENKLKEQDLVSDRPGHYNTSGTSRGSYSEQTSHKEIRLEEFAREIAAILESGRLHKHYEKLIIAAPAKIYGFLRKQINPSIEKLICNHISKDLMQLKQHELLEYLQANTLYPDE